MDKYHYHYERTSNYCYPNSDTLINKLDIKDEKLLYHYERQLVAIRQVELISNPVKGNLDFQHLKDIHQYLFQDLYYWAGEIRTCDIAKKDLFCLSQHIETYAQDIFNSIKRKDFYISYDDEETINHLVTLFGDINALHPFREGNGRTQREFINIIARINGFNISFVNVQADDMIEASHLINNGHEERIHDIFSQNIEKLNREKQLRYIEDYIKSVNLKKKILLLLQ